MIIATAASFAVIGMLLWLLFTLAVYALPFYAGLSAAMWAYSNDAGLLGAAVIALTVAGLTFGIGQVLFARLRSPWLRAMVAAVYATPAAVAGYSAVYGVSGIGGTDEAWRVAFAAAGAVLVAAVTWARVSALYPGHAANRHGWHISGSGQILGSANDG